MLAKSRHRAPLTALTRLVQRRPGASHLLQDAQPPEARPGTGGQLLEGIVALVDTILWALEDSPAAAHRQMEGRHGPE